MPDFIRTHLINKIKQEVKYKSKVLDFNGFFYLVNEINDGNKIINRVNIYSIYSKEELVPLNWYNVKGPTLIEVYSQLKDNNFFIYKNINGKSHKIKIKK